MSDDGYNGWTNRETWAVALHINNDQGWQESVLEALRGATLETSILAPEQDGVPLSVAQHAEDVRLLAQRQAGEIIRENVEELFDPSDYIAGEYTERLRYVVGAMQDIGSLWRVNWDEIGAAFLSDLSEDDAYDREFDNRPARPGHDTEED